MSQNTQEYAKCLSNKIVEWNEDRNIKQMWEQVKQGMTNSGREVWDSVRVGGNPKSVWWHDEVKAVVEKRRFLGRRC